jgi:hypothetical protein
MSEPHSNEGSPFAAPVADPFTRDELRRDLAALGDWSARYWLGFDTAEFFAPLGDAWSPADNVRHLVKSNRPLARALRLPKLLLLLRFGPSPGRSRRYDEVVTLYRAALAGGVTAGRFAARPLAEAERTPAARERFVAERGATLDGVDGALAGWSERTLDRLRLPHPALGKLTVREIVLFTLYHNVHHATNVARRRGGGVVPMSAETRS